MFLFQRVTVGVPYLSCISASRDLSGQKNKQINKQNQQQMAIEEYSLTVTNNRIVKQQKLL